MEKIKGKKWIEKLEKLIKIGENLNEMNKKGLRIEIIDMVEEEVKERIVKKGIVFRGIEERNRG